jgi:hypothetical protein
MQYQYGGERKCNLWLIRRNQTSMPKADENAVSIEMADGAWRSGVGE